MSSFDSEGEFPKKLKHSHSSVKGGDLGNAAAATTPPGGASLPLLFGAIPLMANALFGGSNRWVEVCVVVILLAWVYYIIQTPWNLFIQSKKSKFNDSERFFIIMIFITPLISAYSFHVTKIYLGSQSLLLSDFNIPLFLGVALLRPIIYFLKDSGTISNAPDEGRRLRHQIGKILDRVEALEQVKNIPLPTTTSGGITPKSTPPPPPPIDFEEKFKSLLTIESTRMQLAIKSLQEKIIQLENSQSNRQSCCCCSVVKNAPATITNSIVMGVWNLIVYPILWPLRLALSFFHIINHHEKING